MWISRHWAIAHFLAFCGWPGIGPGVHGCVVNVLMRDSEHVTRHHVQKANLLPSWA